MWENLRKALWLRRALMDSDDEGDDEGMDMDLFQSPLAMGANQLHELLEAYKLAGFDHSDALYLVASIVTGGPKAP